MELNEMISLKFLYIVMRIDAQHLSLPGGIRIELLKHAVLLIEAAYISMGRQNLFNNCLNGFPFNKHVENDVNDISKLENTYKIINNLSPQVSTSHRGDAHKMYLFCSPTVRHTWATQSFIRRETQGLHSSRVMMRKRKKCF